jgi:hypothetical protein
MQRDREQKRLVRFQTTQKRNKRDDKEFGRFFLMWQRFCVSGIIVRFVGEAYVYVPSEEPPQWDMRSIVQLKKAFCVKNKV